MAQDMEKAGAVDADLFAGQMGAGGTPESTSPVWSVGIHELIEFEVADAFEAGIEAERQRIAEGYVVLDDAWVQRARQTYAEKVAARIAEMEAYAWKMPGNTYGGTYPGGPVDFETGVLL